MVRYIIHKLMVCSFYTTNDKSGNELSRFEYYTYKKIPPEKKTKKKTNIFFP